MSADDLTKKQRAILRKFTERTSDLIVPNVELNQGTLIRFLKARNFDLKKAEEMIRASVVWREENEERYFGNSTSTFENWEPPQEIISGFDVYYCGKDYEGRPVYYAPIGMWASARDKFEQGLEEDCLRYAGKSMEQVHQCLLKTKHQNFVCIVDNAGVTFRKAWYETQNIRCVQDLIRLFREYEANYPETLHKAFLINTPTVFYWGFNIVKPLMTQHTLSKINFFCEDETKWMAALHDYLPRETIPVKFGGTCEVTPFWPLEKWTFDMDNNENTDSNYCTEIAIEGN